MAFSPIYKKLMASSARARMPQEDEEMPLAAGFVPVSTGNQQVCASGKAQQDSAQGYRNAESTQPPLPVAPSSQKPAQVPQVSIKTLAEILVKAEDGIVSPKRAAIFAQDLESLRPFGLIPDPGPTLQDEVSLHFLLQTSFSPTRLQDTQNTQKPVCRTNFSPKRPAENATDPAPDTDTDASPSKKSCRRLF